MRGGKRGPSAQVHAWNHSRQGALDRTVDSGARTHRSRFNSSGTRRTADQRGLGPQAGWQRRRGYGLLRLIVSPGRGHSTIMPQVESPVWCAR
jgi:hypothetical protein